MVGPSKILTVSYGTFSCTLEGFDDPFSTMRGIAEYFRDLAADDRYFGAEPPTPDAEMLHKIAEREVKRRVETRIEDGGIILRQAEHAPAAETPSAPAAVAAAAPVAVAAAVTAAAPRPRTETVAEKLARLRAATSENEGLAPDANAPDIDADSAASLAAAFDDFEEDAAASVPEPVQAPEPEEVFVEPAIAEEEAPVEAAVADEPTTAETADIGEGDMGIELPEDVEPATETPVEMAETDPAADIEKTAASEEIQELSADTDADDIVDLSDVDLEADDQPEVSEPVVDLSALEFEEDDAENQPDDGDTIDLESLLADTPDLAHEPATEPAAEDVAENAEQVDSTDDFAALIAAEAEAARIEEEEIAADQEADEQTVGRILKMRRADFEAAMDAEREDSAQPETIIIDPVAEAEFAPEQTSAEDAGQEIENGFSHDDDALAADLADTLDDVSGLDDADSAATESNDFADVETVASEEAIDDIVEAEDPSEVIATVEDAQPEAEVQEQDGSSLTDEDEAELLASLTRLENEEFDEDDDDDDADFSDVPIAEPRVASTSVERLFQVTNSELAGRESSRRRSAIAHLKAAVAATRADRDFADALPSDAEKTDEDFDITAYREDLARVVRPKRPVEKPNTGPRRLPPLMLVSEQRVDEQVEDAVTAITGDAVRPRRVAADELADQPGDDDASDNIFAEANSFAEFAEEMGARELPDMLEAAAAYYSYVEGQPHFSRPQIMKAVAAINADGNFTREDGLRSFGQLLRHGKIRKIRRGQFEIDKSTRFKPAPLQLGA